MDLSLSLLERLASSKEPLGISELARLRERFDVLAIAHDDLARLGEETGQPVTLSALVENRVVVLEVL